MPDHERAICRRLRTFRLSLGLSQAEFCKLAGLSRTAYAGYEYETSQLNYPAAWRILNAFPDLNPQWLAGEHPLAPMRQMWFVDYPAPEEAGLGPRAAFSTVYELHLKRLLLLSLSGILIKGKMPMFRVTPDARGRVVGKEKYAALLARWLSHQPDSKVVEFLDALLQRASDVLKKFPPLDEITAERQFAEMCAFEAKRRLASLNQDLSKAAGAKNNLLTHVAASGKLTPVKSQLSNLLADLSRLTQEPGMKSKLARFLGAPLTSVSRWLSGEREPGGETTLRLLEWVRAEEAEQKSPDSATTPAGQKTQVKSKYETLKSRKKR